VVNADLQINCECNVRGYVYFMLCCDAAEEKCRLWPDAWRLDSDRNQRGKSDLARREKERFG
jgi:hypothetical protein